MFHLTGEQWVRLAAILPPLLTAGAALTASLTSLLVALHARRAAHRAQRTADDATSQAVLATKEQIKFALGEFVRRRDAAPVSPISPVSPVVASPKEGGSV